MHIETQICMLRLFNDKIKTSPQAYLQARPLFASKLKYKSAVAFGSGFLPSPA